VFQVTSIPTFMVFQNGKQKELFKGADQQKLQDTLKNLK